MAIALTIDGASQVMQAGSLNLSKVANGRGRTTFSVRSLDASYRPALDDEVIITENSNRIFGGIIDSVRERGASDQGDAIITEIVAVDFNVYADRRLVSIAIQPGNLREALEALEPYLTPYGISLDAGQVDGPDLPLLGFTLKYMTEVLNELMSLTADFGEPFVWNIDDFKVLSATQPSTVPAPFDVDGTSLPIPEVIGDLIVESKRGANFANRFVVYMPPINVPNHVETFAGDGSTTAFVLQYTLYAHRGYVTSDGVFETLSIGGGGTWDYNPSTNTITRTSAPGSGDVITIEFDGTFSALADAEDSASVTAIGLFEKFVVVDSIPGDTTAQAMADAYLARYAHLQNTAKYRTSQAGLMPGQSQTINVPRRNINETAIITEVVIRDIGKELIVRDVTTATDDSQTNLGRGWRDVYKRWNSGGGSGGSVASAVTIGTGVPPGQGGVASVDFHVVKTADEIVNNSDTLQDDDHLFFQAEASSLYFFEINLMCYSDSNVAKWKFGLTFPSGTVIRWGVIGESGNSWSGGSHLTGSLWLMSQSDVVTGSSQLAMVRENGKLIRGWLITSTTPGTVRLQWAQNAPDTIDNTVKKYSFIKYRRVSGA